MKIINFVLISTLICLGINFNGQVAAFGGRGGGARENKRDFYKILGIKKSST
jgi:hypothetical protein